MEREGSRQKQNGGAQIMRGRMGGKFLCGCVLRDADSYGFEVFETAKEPNLTRSFGWIIDCFFSYAVALSNLRS